MEINWHAVRVVAILGFTIGVLVGLLTHRWWLFGIVAAVLAAAILTLCLLHREGPP